MSDRKPAETLLCRVLAIGVHIRDCTEVREIYRCVVFTESCGVAKGDVSVCLCARREGRRVTPSWCFYYVDLLSSARGRALACRMVRIIIRPALMPGVIGHTVIDNHPDVDKPVLDRI